MDRWLTYIKERFPLATFMTLVAGISLSGIYLYKKHLEWIPLIISFIGILMFFALLRLMDEVKDVEKDKIANPERPLPRGLIAKHEAIHVIDISIIFHFCYSLVVWVFTNQIAGLAFACVTFYLWMMYKEFGIGTWLTKHPLLYGISHQLIVFPVTFFAIACASPEKVFSGPSWALGLMFLGAFFCYEICRKFNPHLHPILQTYVHHYGFRRSYEIAAICLVLASVGAIALHLQAVLIPTEILVLVAMTVLFFNPNLYKLPEVAASLSLLVHVWAVVFYRYMGLFS